MFQEEIWQRMGNIVLSNNSFCQYPRRIPSTIYIQDGRWQVEPDQKPLIEGLIPYLLVPAWRTTDNKFDLMWSKDSMQKQLYRREARSRLEKTSGSYPVPSKGCPNEQSCWGKPSWVMYEIRDPSSFQFLCLNSSYVLLFSLNPYSSFGQISTGFARGSTE